MASKRMINRLYWYAVKERASEHLYPWLAEQVLRDALNGDSDRVIGSLLTYQRLAQKHDPVGLRCVSDKTLFAHRWKADEILKEATHE